MTNQLSHLQNLSVSPLVAAVLVLAVLALVIHEPIAGKKSYAKFLRAEAIEGEPARLRFYRSWILQGCAAAALAIGLVLALPGIGLAEIGFRPTGTSGLDRFGLSGGTGAGLIAGMTIGAAIGAAVLAVVERRKPKSGTTTTPAQLVAIQPMLPRTGRGRWGWSGLSLSAGVTEEITYRGLLILTLAIVLPSQTPAAVFVIVTAVVFGAAHWYQGRTGMVATGAAGAALTILYLGTGSLLVPMILHTLMDLRALTLPTGAGTAGTGAPTEGVPTEDDAASGTIVPAQTTNTPA